MELIHTLLFMLRENTLEEDLLKAKMCLKTLEKSTCKKVLVFNQGFWDNQRLSDYLKGYELECEVIGEGVNVGIVVGRQRCFEHVWEHCPEAKFVSELHLDMIFTHNWEDPLVDYLNTHDDPVISCGIVEKDGALKTLNTKANTLPKDAENMDEYLSALKQNTVAHGFTHPCIHKTDILKAVGGYDIRFLVGKQAFEDDSLLLGYHYYFGTKANWRPKVNYNSVVYHELGGQRYGMIGDNVMINFDGLVRQYGAMGLKHLSMIHQSAWHIRFFSEGFLRM